MILQAFINLLFLNRSWNQIYWYRIISIFS